MKGSLTLSLLAIALGLILPAQAQDIPSLGMEETLEVATWNIEWFGSPSNGPGNEERQFANVKAIIEQAGIDLWALQEISDTDTFERLLDELGAGFDGVLATQSGAQRIGFIYKTDVIDVRSSLHLLTQFSADFAGRPPLQIQADVTLLDKTHAITFIVLHMKAFSDRDSYEKRLQASIRLKSHLDFFKSDLALIVLGDFNDEVLSSTRAGQPSPYDNFFQDQEDYFFPSLSLEEANIGTFCGNNNPSCTSSSTIDHIMISDEVVPHYQPSSAMRFDGLLPVDNFVSTTSDHLPVVARFRFDTSTAAEAADVPATLILQAAYPNPFYKTTTLSYSLPHAANVRLDVYDVVGRHRTSRLQGYQPPGSHHVLLDAHDLPPGLYLVRFQANDVIQYQRLLRLR